MRLRGRRPLTAEVPTQHKIQNEETVLIVLERIPQVYDERVVDLVKGER